MPGQIVTAPVLATSKEDMVTFEARVHSAIKSNLAEQLTLELRVQETLLNANLDATVIGQAAWEKAQKLTPESIVHVTGSLYKNKAEANGQTPHLNGNTTTTVSETTNTLQVVELTVIAQAVPNLPSQFHRDDTSIPGLEERLDNRILDVRNAAAGAIFKLSSGVNQLIVEYLCSHGFHWIQTPRIISATIAGDNEYFPLHYFGRETWLAQSTQHHKQMALSMDMQRVFEIGPVFRAEVKSGASARHLTEFTVLDIGMVFEDDYHEVVELIESMLVFVLRALQERKQYRQLTETIQRCYPSARPSSFRIGLDENGKVPRITFLEAKRILREELGFETEDKKNFTDQEEAALGAHFRSSPHLGQTDIFTIDQYPASMRQFNSRASANGLSNSWDTIIRGREICSGSQRINEYDELCHAMRAGVCGLPLDPEAPKWQPYLTAFRTGMPRHGGCGLGVNRVLQGFLGFNDVREVTMFPRDVNRATP